MRGGIGTTAPATGIGQGRRGDRLQALDPECLVGGGEALGGRERLGARPFDLGQDRAGTERSAGRLAAQSGEAGKDDLAIRRHDGNEIGAHPHDRAGPAVSGGGTDLRAPDQDQILPGEDLRARQRIVHRAEIQGADEGGDPGGGLAEIQGRGASRALEPAMIEALAPLRPRFHAARDEPVEQGGETGGSGLVAAAVEAEDGVAGRMSKCSCARMAPVSMVSSI